MVFWGEYDGKVYRFHSREMRDKWLELNAEASATDRANPKVAEKIQQEQELREFYANHGL
jgi:hypothetical protein